MLTIQLFFNIFCSLPFLEAGQCLSQQLDHRALAATPESTLLALLEKEAKNIAASVDGLTEHLAVSLHTV